MAAAPSINLLKPVPTTIIHAQEPRQVAFQVAAVAVITMAALAAIVALPFLASIYIASFSIIAGIAIVSSLDTHETVTYIRDNKPCPTTHIIHHHTHDQPLGRIMIPPYMPIPRPQHPIHTAQSSGPEHPVHHSIPREIPAHPIHTARFSGPAHPVHHSRPREIPPTARAPVRKPGAATPDIQNVQQVFRTRAPVHNK